MSQIPTTLQALIQEIAHVIQMARGQVRQAVNQTMVASYWEVGRLIVEHEQKGEARAAYGKQQLQYLSQQLTGQFGRGFDVTNLRNMRRFYHAFPIRETLSLELSWSHYNALARLENTQARQTDPSGCRADGYVQDVRYVAVAWMPRSDHLCLT